LHHHHHHHHHHHQCRIIIFLAFLSSSSSSGQKYTTNEYTLPNHTAATLSAQEQAKATNPTTTMNSDAPEEGNAFWAQKSALEQVCPSSSCRL
jgi:hypothetical protein